MENNKITIFLNQEYIDYDYIDFINMFIKNEFFTCKVSIIEDFILKPLRIKEEDKQKVIDTFLSYFIDLENYLLNANKQEKLSQIYKDSLYKYLITIKFILLNTKQKIVILKKLNIDDNLIEKLIEEFTLDSFK